MKRIVGEDPEAVAAAAERFVVRRARAAVADRGRFRLVLAGGSTPRRLYERLAATAEIDWGAVSLFLGDERCVPAGDERRNDRMAREALPVPAAFHPIPAELGPEEGAARYARLLLDLAGEDPLRFDLVLLGMGADGHTASLFPGTPDLAADPRIAAPGRAPVEPRDRVTLTLKTINAARSVAFLVTGAAKAGALRRIAAGELLPAGLVRPASGDLTFFLDRAAAGGDA